MKCLFVLQISGKLSRERPREHPRGLIFPVVTPSKTLHAEAPTKCPTKVSTEVPTKSVHSSGQGLLVLLSPVLFIDQPCVVFRTVRKGTVGRAWRLQLFGEFLNEFLQRFFSAKFSAFVSPGFQAPKNSCPKSLAFLFNFTFWSPKVLRANFLAYGGDQVFLSLLDLFFALFCFGSCSWSLECFC